MKQQRIAIVSCMLIVFALIMIIHPRAAEAAVTYADGEYTVPFNVYKDTSDEISATSDYMISPAKLIIENGMAYAVVTLNNGSWWQYFRTESAQAGSFADVTLMNQDVDKDTKVVKFEVSDIEQPLNAKLHIIVTGIPGFDYDNKYDIRLKFDYSGLPIAQETPKSEPPAEPTPQTDNKVDAQPKDTADAKPKPKPEQQLQLEPTAQPKPTLEDNASATAPETIVEAEIDEETAQDAIEANTEPMEDDVDGEAANESSSSSITEAISKQAEDQLTGAETADPAEDSKPSSTNKAIYYSLLALGLIVLSLVLIRLRKRKT